MYSKIKSLIFLILILNTANLFSQEYYYDNDQIKQRPIIRKHLGFFFRTQLGIGAANISTDDKINNKVDYNSDFLRSSFFNIMVGGAIVNNLIMYAGLNNLSSKVVYKPKSASNNCGYDVFYNNELKDCYGNYNLLGLSLGITYYFMPVNIFISGDLRYSIGDLQSDSVNSYFSYNYNNGMGVSFQVGKEWYINYYSGIGVALFYERSLLSSEAINGRVQGKATSNQYGILFTSTYN